MKGLKSIKICFLIILLIYYINILTNYAYPGQEQQPTQNEGSYTEVLLGDEQTPFILLGREILSSNDILECSTNHNEVLQRVVENNLRQVSDIAMTNSDRLDQKSTERSFHDLLLAFPFTALNKPFLIGALVTKFSDQDNAHYQTKYHRDIFKDHQLALLNAKGVQAHLASSNNSGCSLNFVLCDNGGDCKDENGQLIFYVQIPVLGISQKHQAVIIDPVFLGNYLNDKIAMFRPNTSPESNQQEEESLISTKDHRSFVVDFSHSTLVFDVISTLNWEGPPPFAEMTSRWFIKFGLDQSDFISRPPTQGVEYLIVYSLLQNGPLIVTRDISKDNPVKYYVKNVPNEFQESVREGFEYWNSISIALMGYPLFSYTFIQGDYDGQQEIIAGDIRYNVLEWNFQNKYPYNGLSLSLFDNNTAQILSTNILLQGPRLMEKYSKWFEYSKTIRAGEVIRDTLPTDALENDNLISSIQLPGFPPHLQVVTLAPQTETLESYMQGFITALTAHELGHSLGLAHHPKGNIFAQGEYASHSAMDELSFHTNHKPFSRDYDEMQLAYGYLGRLPHNTDMSCENGIYNFLDGRDQSPECSRDDETIFPLENFAIRLKEVFDLLMTRKDDQSFPYLIWNGHVHEYFLKLIAGILAYYSSADTYYDNLQTVFIDGQKPQSPQEVKDLVMSYIHPIACDSTLNSLFREYIIRNPNDSVFNEALQFNSFNFLNSLQNEIFSRTDIRTISCVL